MFRDFSQRLYFFQGSVAIGGQSLVNARAFHLVGMHIIGDFAYDMGRVSCNDASLRPCASCFEKRQGPHNTPRSNMHIVHDHGIHADEALCA